MITPSDEVKMHWSANIAPCSSIISKVSQLWQLVLLSPTACGIKRRRSGHFIIYALRSDAATVARQVLQRAMPSFFVLLEALIEVHPVHEQQQALLVAGAPSSSAAKSAIQLSGTSPKSAVVVNILLTPLVVENDICSARVQTRDL